ncbi:MAG: hypothetical protein GY801_31735, partial [bacterium]|nr:hypothetical protein [bacterium]
VARCEIKATAQVIADIRAYDSSLADVLKGFADEFEYATIFAAIRESQSPPHTPQARASLPEA